MFCIDIQKRKISDYFQEFLYYVVLEMPLYIFSIITHLYMSHQGNMMEACRLLWTTPLGTDVVGISLAAFDYYSHEQVSTADGLTKPCL